MAGLRDALGLKNRRFGLAQPTLQEALESHNAPLLGAT